MTARLVSPAIVFGRVSAPPSKSYTHRAVLAAHFADHPYRIDRPLVCEDTLATLRGVGALGTTSVQRPEVWELAPPSGGASDRRVRIDCGESGTTLRFLLPAAACRSNPVEFAGGPRLRRRPIRDGLAVLRAAGVHVASKRSQGGIVEVQGPMAPVSAPIDTSESSQFLSGLLFALPRLSRPSALRRTGPIVSEPYIDATLRVLTEHSIEVDRIGRRISVPAPQSYSGNRLAVPGDASSAAYLWAAAAITGGTVDVLGIDEEWPQADLAILPWLEAMGAVVARGPDWVRVSGRTMGPVRANLTDCPDLLPLLGVLAAATPGRSVLIGASHARSKESDRRAETVRLVRAMGAKVAGDAKRLTIEGTARPRGFAYGGAGDHRMVMSAAIGALAADRPSRIGSAGAVAKSYPEFWQALRALGARTEVGR